MNLHIDTLQKDDMALSFCCYKNRNCFVFSITSNQRQNNGDLLTLKFYENTVDTLIVYVSQKIELSFTHYRDTVK